MRGRYIYPACGTLGLESFCFLRNTFRNSSSPDISEDIVASIKIYNDGKKVYENLSLVQLGIGGYKEIKISELVSGYDAKKNYMVIVDTVKDKADDFSYFPQEHQVEYQNAQGNRAALLYDQQPAFARGGKYSPIIVLAPKVLVGKDINSYCVIANYRAEEDNEQQSEPLEISLIDQNGKLVGNHKKNLKFNSTYIFDVKECLGEDFKYPDSGAEFLNLTAKSGEAIYAILVIIKNERTGNIGIEHSLPPHYYVSGEKSKIRAEALKIVG
jgi:hypothetical protein